MKAELLLQGMCDNTSLPKTDITVLTENSKRADAQTLFVCIRGAHRDGHNLAIDAYNRGCRLFVAEHLLDLPKDAVTVTVPNTKQALASLACRFYGDPSHSMHVVGITGTKGKTTTAHMLAQILNTNGIPCGYIGTNGVRFADIEEPLDNTTPDAVTLQKAFRRMADSGMRAAVVEISSQALLQFRADGTRFQTVIFTNLAVDHIGTHEHPDFENYKACKHRLFTDFGAETAIANADDTATQEMLAGCSAPTVRLISTQSNKADYGISDLVYHHTAVGFEMRCTVNKEGEQALLTIPLIGKMNIENALLAIAAASESFSISVNQAAKALQSISISGRSQIVPLPNGALAVIDYAHNEASLRTLLTELRAYRPTRLIALFGSVGGRTRQRRYPMGQVASELCDLCILTSDNPAEESPEQIIAEIAEAFENGKTPYLTIPDRAEAIRRAVALAKAGDILVLAGKGHENYQLIGKEKRPFCEGEILNSAIQEHFSKAFTSHV